MQAEMMDVRAIPMFSMACGREMKELCSDAQRSGSEIHQCLLKHVDDLDKMSSDCKSAVEDVEVNRATDVRLCPQLTRRCGKDINRLCNRNPKIKSLDFRTRNTARRRQKLCARRSDQLSRLQV